MIAVDEVVLLLLMLEVDGLMLGGGGIQSFSKEKFMRGRFVMAGTQKKKAEKDCSQLDLV